LQNKWLEKQVLAKRKQNDESNGEENGSNERASASNGSLVKKMRLNGVKNGKGKKVNLS